MSRTRRYFCPAIFFGLAALAPHLGAGAVVGRWSMEVDELVGELDPNESNLQVPDTSGAGGSPFTTDQGRLIPPGANSSANGADGWERDNPTNPDGRNIDGRILHYDALNSASVRMSGYFRSDEATGQLFARSNISNINPLTFPDPPIGFSVHTVNSVVGAAFFVESTLYTFDSSPAIDLSFGTDEAPAWTKITFSYDATSGVASLFENDQPRGTLTVPVANRGPMFIPEDILDITVGNGAVGGGGFDGGGGGLNVGPIVDELVYENTAGGTTPTFREGDFDENGTVAAADLDRWKLNYGTGTTHMQGNADGDTDVDGNDFLVWQKQLGLTSPTATSAPEPGALGAIGACCGIVLRCVSRRRSRRR